jgi:hypothetical protein
VAVLRAEPSGEQPLGPDGRVVDAPARLIEDDGAAASFEGCEQVGGLPSQHGAVPERVDVWPQREGELAVAIVEIAFLTVQGEPRALRPHVTDGESDSVDDAELCVPFLLVAKALPLAAVEAIGPLVEGRLLRRQPGIRRLPRPEAFRPVLWIHGP